MKNKNLILTIIAIIVLFVGCSNQQTKTLKNIKGETVIATKTNIRSDIDIIDGETLYIYNVYDNKIMFGISEPYDSPTGIGMVNTTRYVGVYDEEKRQTIAHHNVEEDGEVSNMMFHNGRFYYSMLLLDGDLRGYPWAVYSVKNDEEKKLMSSTGVGYYFWGSPTFATDGKMLVMLYESLDDEGYSYGINIIDDDDNIKNVFERKSETERLNRTDIYIVDEKLVFSTHNKQDEIGKFHIIDKNFEEETITKRKNAVSGGIVGNKIVCSYYDEETKSWNFEAFDVNTKKEVIAPLDKQIYFVSQVDKNRFVASRPDSGKSMFEITNNSIIESKVDIGECNDYSIFLKSSGDAAYLNCNMNRDEDAAVFKVDSSNAGG